MNSRTSALLGAAALLLAGCHPEAPEGSLVLTQTPAGAPSPAPVTVLDARYPPGSRVVLLAPPYGADTVRELSRGLVAAGDPCVSWDGRSVYFSGKSSTDADWQIYRVSAGGGRPEVVTRVPGGAMNPAVAAHGELVFSSPVPKAGTLWTTQEPAALYGQMPGEAPSRLTFGSDSAVDATVLRDGRILYVTSEARDTKHAVRHLEFFTVNNDGTEVTAYACEDGGADRIRRPRELGDGRVAFLAAPAEEPGPAGWAESVKSAAPFATRGKLFAFRSIGCRSVEPMGQGEVLACIDSNVGAGRMMIGTAKVFRVAPDATETGAPLFGDPKWDNIEAAPVAARAEPNGHTSALNLKGSYGTLLCLNVNFSSKPAAAGNLAPAAQLRIFTWEGPGKERTLGEVPVESDGSVIVQLPADTPLGLDTLDAAGHVLRHQPAALWLRPGENRACIGCHEPRNHAPQNVRPLATMHRPAHLDLNSATTGPQAPKP